MRAIIILNYFGATDRRFFFLVLFWFFIWVFSIFHLLSDFMAQKA